MSDWTRRSVLGYGVSLSAGIRLSGDTPILRQVDTGSNSVALYGGDRLNSGRYQADPITQPAGIEWEYEASESVNSVPAIVDDRIFVGTDDHKLHVINAQTGEGEVAYESGLEADESHLSAVPAVLDGTVYITFSSNAGNPVKPESEVVALDSNTFAVQWRFEPENTIYASVVPTESTVYVGADSEIYALEATSGRTRWSTDTGEKGSLPNVVPAITENAIIAPTVERAASISRVSRESGEVDWDFGAGSSIKSSPAVDSGTVYFGSFDESLYALDLQSGIKEWEFQAGDFVTGHPSVADGTVYVGTRGNTLYAVDSNSGEEQWSYEFSKRDTAWVTGKPAIVDGVVYVGSWDRTIAALSADSGDELWTLELGGNIRAGVVPVGDRLYVPCHNGILYSLAPGADRPTEAVESDSSSDGSNLSDKIIDQPSLLGGITALSTVLAGAGIWKVRSLDNSESSDTSSPSDPGPDDSDNRVSNSSSEAVDPYTLTGAPEQISEPPAASLSYGDFTNRDQIGTGGNADVYHATVSSKSSLTDIAVKEPRFTGTAHSEDIDRLLTEAKTWASLDDHDHVVSIIDYGSNPLPWIAMEYMSGGNLNERVSDFSISQALWTAYAITRGVRHAHRQGIAHLDLKPENILFQTVEDAWDVPKIGDWGFSQRLIDTTHALEGLSPHYAAPEQFDEKFGQTDERTDIYQLGAVCYKLFTGQPPFSGSTTNVMQKVLTKQVTPPSEVNTALPSEVDDIVATALSKEKSDRYESVLYFRDHLADFIDTADQTDYTFSNPNSSASAPNPDSPSVSTESSSVESINDQGDTAPEQNDTQIPTSSGPSYADIRVGDPISRNNISTVYQALTEVRGESKRLALKEPHLNQTVSKDVIDQFAKEASQWEKLSKNEGIVEVIGWGVNPAPWIAMEYLDRGDLEEVVGDISPLQTIAVGSQLSEAVYYAHSRGIAHLDLKPTNVLLGSGTDGTTLKIADWGIGKLSLQHSRSADGLDLAYTAPEQIDENNGTPGPATDVYALGAICYKLFTDVEPFTGTPAEIMRATLAGEFTPPSDIDQTLPHSVDTILKTAMAVDPSDRYESVLYLRDALQDLT